MSRSHSPLSHPLRTTGATALLVLLLLGGCGRGEDPAPAADPPPTAPAADLALPAQSYPEGVREALRTALGAYEAVGAELAADRLDEVAPQAARLAAALGMAADAPGPTRGPVEAVLGEAARIATALADAPTLEAAREIYAEQTRLLMPLLAADATLTEGLSVFECPMLSEERFAKWVQSRPEPANPYMGTEMLSCASDTDWSVPAPASLAGITAHAAAAHGDPDEIAWYTCAMHPSVQSPRPGDCPICGMTLTPVTRGEAAAGIVRLDAERRQRIGVRIAPAETRRLTVPVRAVGRVAVDETRLSDVTVKYEGWITDLHVDQVGQAVRRGQPLFTLYSPDLYAAQQDYVTALASQRAARGTAAPDRVDYLVRAARQRLRLWDLSDAQIRRLEEGGAAVERVTVPSPASGVVIEKEVVAGSPVAPGMRLYRLAGLDRVWVEADVSESELPLLRVGDPAEVTFPYLPGRAFTGRVAFIHPMLDPQTRTGRVRVELPNFDLELKPDMYANVTLQKDLGERVMVPEEAVIYAGERRFVFLDLGDGRLQPLPVVTGLRTDEWVEIVSGLAAGDRVVTSGNFLIAAESRLKAAMDQWGGPAATAPTTPPPPVHQH